MNDEPLLKERMLETINRYGLTEGEAKSLRDELVTLYNEHSRDTAMLNWREKDRLKRLERLQSWLQRRMDTRDEAREQEIKESLGDRYRDFLAMELSALDWSIKFIKEHSI